MINDRQRKFAQLVVQGIKSGPAYAKVYKTKGAAADSCATKLLRKAEVCAYISKLRAKAIASADVDAAELFRFHRDVLRTPIGDIDENHPLAQEVRVSDGQKTVKMSAKMDAARELAKLMDLYSPEKLEVNSTIEIVIGSGS